MAVGMAVIVAKMLRHERARSSARVEALSALAAEPARATGNRPVGAAYPRLAERIDCLHEPSASVRLMTWKSVRQSPVSRICSRSRSRPRHGVHGLIVIGCSLAFYSRWDRIDDGASRATTPSATSAVHAATAPPAAATPAVATRALRHWSCCRCVTRRSPTGSSSPASCRTRATAPASPCRGHGIRVWTGWRFLSSSRAPLDFMTLTPGEESPFVVNVPVTGQVARYRVGFRTEDGHVLPHVDKRAPDALAQK